MPGPCSEEQARCTGPHKVAHAGVLALEGEPGCIGCPLPGLPWREMKPSWSCGTLVRFPATVCALMQHSAVFRPQADATACAIGSPHPETPQEACSLLRRRRRGSARLLSNGLQPPGKRWDKAIGQLIALGDHRIGSPLAHPGNQGREPGDPGVLRSGEVAPG